MKRALTPLALLALLLTLPFWSDAQPRTPAQQLQHDTGLTVGQAYRHGNLTIFPIVSREPRRDDRFITLDEGLKAGTVEVLEMSVGAERGAVLPSAPESDRSQRSLPNETKEDPFAEDETSTAATRNEGPTQTVRLPTQTGEANPFADPFDGDQGEALQRSDADAGDHDLFGAGAGNDVNRLLVVNRSEKPLYLMPGEILLGGDQDRTVGQELVIAPSGKPVPIEVFCVEHGRWGSRDAQELSGYVAAARGSPSLDDSVGLAPAVLDARGISAGASLEANSGKFIGSVGSLNKQARLAVQRDGEQGRVWEEVAKENAKAKVYSDSGTFVGQYASADATQRLEPYIETLQAPVAEHTNIVGVIVAVNGNVETLDVFESTPLFRKLWPKLLKSYALDAANAKVSTEQICSHPQAVSFLSDIAQSNTDRTQRHGDAAVRTVDTEDALLFSFHADAAANEGSNESSRPFVTQVVPTVVGGESAPRMMGGYGGAIHSAAFAK